jgi:hypothetical protein
MHWGLRYKEVAAVVVVVLTVGVVVGVGCVAAEGDCGDNEYC